MRIRVGYQTDFAYERPLHTAVSLLRLEPRPHGAQRISRWRVSVDAPGRLRRGEDAFGNVLHAFYLDAPTDRLVIRVDGEAEVVDSAGVLKGCDERFAPEVFLRETPLTTADAAIAQLAAEIEAQTPDRLSRLHALMLAIKARMVFATGASDCTTTAAQALANGRGVCQDMAQVFISAARRFGAPARYVSGHLFRPETCEQEAGHAWAEAYVEGLGWIGFDPANGVCPTEAHLRVAVGPDALAAAPVRGARSGGGLERLAVRLTIEQAQPAATRAGPSRQAQSQSQ